MAIGEQQLETWSAQGSKQQSAATYQAIKRVLEDPRSPYAGRSFSVFLQGSYGNDTNIYADSDVDIVICLTSVYYSMTNNLDESEKARYDKAWSAASYTFSEFRNEVTSWLRENFGHGVTAGNKAIFVPGDSSRRDADVLACAEHHDYYSYPAQGSPGFFKGVCFWTSAGEKIVNYPKQHLENCTLKNSNTHTRFKPTARVLKNMRNSMVEKRYIEYGRSPSYFIEGMLYNVPGNLFEMSRQGTIENVFQWLRLSEVPKLLCANERYYLVFDGSPVCWNKSDFNATLDAFERFWDAGGR